MTKREKLEERLDQLQQMADGENDYTDYCKLQQAIYRVRSQLNRLPGIAKALAIVLAIFVLAHHSAEAHPEDTCHWHGVVFSCQ